MARGADVFQVGNSGSKHTLCWSLRAPSTETDLGCSQDSGIQPGGVPSGFIILNSTLSARIASNSLAALASLGVRLV